MIGGLSEFESDEDEDLLQPSQQGDEIFQGRYAMNIMQVDVTTVGKDEVAEAAPAPKQLKDGDQAIVDDLNEINLGSKQEPRPTYTNALLSAEEQEQYQVFLHKHQGCFAWSYKEMPGLDPEVAMHKLVISCDIKLSNRLSDDFAPSFKSILLLR